MDASVHAKAVPCKKNCQSPTQSLWAKSPPLGSYFSCGQKTYKYSCL